MQRLVTPLALAVLLAGCAMQFDSRSLGVPVAMAAAPDQPVAGDTFNVTTRAVHLFWGLAAVKEPALQPVLAGQLGTGGSVANLTIRARKRLPDIVATVLTLGFVTTTSVTYSGVIVPRAGAGP